MNLDVFLRLATPDSSDKNPIPFGGTSVGGSRAARSELHGPSVATLPRYSALRLFTHTQLCRALLRERHDDASASASASANTTSSRSVGRDWCCRRGTEMQHCRSSRRSAMRSTMRSTCHVTSAFHCQPVSRRTGRGRRPPSLSSYSVVRARLLSPISSKSAAGTMLRPNEKVFSAYTEANTGSVLSRAIPSGGEEREREREREASLARGLTRVAASCPSFGGKATTTTKPSVPAAGRIPGHDSATAAPVPPLPSSCSASPLPPISLPPGAKRTQEGSRALARRTGSRKKEGGGVCPRHQETERERAQRSQPFITTITHHHQPSPANDTCSCWPPRPSWPLYFHDLRRSSERARLLPMGARAHIPSRRRRAERRLR